MNLPLPIRLLLWPLSVVYGVAARLHAWLYAEGIYSRRHLDAPVVSVGNLTTGGTGKTPMVLWLAERFLAEHKRVAILSRGYRGTGGSSDEVEMMKKRLGDRVVFGVGPDRYKEGKRVGTEHPVNLFLLDDGFQHLELIRDFDIVMVDSTTFGSNRWLLPAGVMREPLSALRRASAVVMTRTRGAEQEPAAIDEIRAATHAPIFTAETKLLGWRRLSRVDSGVAASDEAPAQPVFAFCGIGNPDAFFSDVKSWGIEPAGQQAFRDHHAYTAHDVKLLEERAQQAGAKSLLTTEKDIQNLKKLRFTKLPLYCCRIALEIRQGEELCALIKKKIAAREANIE
jgi:tetraacyldisaccharide 4'-kinase